MATSAASRTFPGTPRLLRLVSLRMSSAMPMRPKLIVTIRIIQMKLTVRLAQRKVEMTVAKMISTPPMVGVPFFERCESGPSSRIGWPICRDCNFRIIHGPRMKQITRAVIAA